MHTKAVLSGNDARLCNTELGRLKPASVESTDPVLSFMTEPKCPKWATLESGASFFICMTDRSGMPQARHLEVYLVFMTEMGCPKRAILESTEPVLIFMTEPGCPKRTILDPRRSVFICMTDPGCQKRARLAYPRPRSIKI